MPRTIYCEECGGFFSDMHDHLFVEDSFLEAQYALLRIPITTKEI